VLHGLAEAEVHAERERRDEFGEPDLVLHAEVLAENSATCDPG
jgi:hypothetical protein